MATERRSEAIWIESKGYWEIKVQKNGVRVSRRSSTPGRKGKHEAEAKADKWLAQGTAEMRFSAAWDAYLNGLQNGTGTGNYQLWPVKVTHGVKLCPVEFFFVVYHQCHGRYCPIIIYLRR